MSGDADDCFAQPNIAERTIALATPRSFDALRPARLHAVEITLRSSAKLGEPRRHFVLPGVEAVGLHVAAASFRPQDRDLRFGRIHVAVLNCTSCSELRVEWARMGVPTRAHLLDKRRVASV